jgi:protein SCO1/2
VALAYKVFLAKSAVVGPDGYAIDHTGFVYLVGKDGRYIDFLPPGLALERITEALRFHLDRQNGP